MTSPPTAAAELRARVLGAVQREPAPPRPVTVGRRAAIVALGFLAAATIALVRFAIDRAARPPVASSVSGRAWHVVAAGGWASQGRPLGYVLTLELVWVLVALGATWLGVARGKSMLGRSTASKIVVATLTPVALITTWLLAAFAWLPAVLPLAWLEAMDDAPDLQFHTSCGLMSVAYAAGPLLAFLAIRRGKDPVSPRQAGAAMGAVAGAWGAVAHFPFCQCTSPLHMALGHVLPVAMLASLGALVGDRMLGVRRSPARA